MTRINTKIFILFSSLLLITKLYGQDSTKYIMLSNFEKNIVSNFSKQSIDTFLFFRYGSFDYNNKDSSFKSLVLWKENSSIYKQLFRDSGFISNRQLISDEIINYLFNQIINTKKRKHGKKSKIYSRHYINPSSNFFSIRLYYKTNYYDRIFEEDFLVVEEKYSGYRKIDKKLLNLIKTELDK